MVSIFGHSVYHFDVVTVWFCLLAVSQAAYVNVALNKPAYIQDQWYNDWDASNAVDGRKSDLSSSGGQCAESQDGQTTTWWLDLTTIHSIHHITIYFMTNGFGLDFYTGLSNYFLGFSVYVSNTTDRLHGTLCYKDDNFTALTIPAVFTTTCPLHGKYVIYYNERRPGVTNPRGYSTTVHSRLCEVEVYGCPGGFYGPNCSNTCPNTNCYCHLETGTCQGCKPGYTGHLCKSVNVALNKPAYQQYPYGDSDRWDASNAVDGRKSDLSASGGQCAVSEWKQTATWWVNLTTIHSIHNITIYFTTENNLQDFYTGLSNYFLGFSVYVSNTPDRLHGTLCYKDDNFTALTIPVVFTTTCPVHGQYVIYYNERLPGVIYPRGYSPYVDSNLCEVEVYECPGGFYGPTCSNACPDTNCYCHLETGTCQGCKPGYQGYLCKSACGRGYYGVECQQECGHCHGLTKCFHTNGSCLTGCEAGYHGEACKASCQYGFFGPDCLHECNDTCDGCNRFNGSCDSGCNPGWQGYECQEVNVALNKPAYQQYPFRRWGDYIQGDDSWDASNAVDGRKSDLNDDGGQCALSWSKQTATWWVDLTTIHSIHNITIYFRTDNDLQVFYGSWSKYYLGFSVYVSNTTDRLQGTLCYKDDDFTALTIPVVFNTTCPVHGQYVIYYNERLPGVIYPRGYSSDVFSSLCEVEVYGCPGGFYGAYCTNACTDTNCYCHLETGTCQGCKPGYQGYLCKSACGRGYYGPECQQECGHCRDLTKCFHINGSCLTGCEAGYHGEACKASCPYGLFGPDCLEECNNTCDGCNRFNGSCDSGCNPGWQGYECQDDCEKGSFGDDCSETCGHCRDIDQCANINGTCLTGCAAGYQGDLCKTSCGRGYYGAECQQECGHCRDLTQCVHTNGSCLTGCEAGYHGETCVAR